MSEQFKSALERRVERIEEDQAKLETAVEDIANTLLALRSIFEAVAERNDGGERGDSQAPVITVDDDGFEHTPL